MYVQFNDLTEQSLQLFSRRCPHAMKFRHAVLHAIDPIAYLAMQVNVEVSSWTETLDNSERGPLRAELTGTGFIDRVGNRCGCRHDLCERMFLFSKYRPATMLFKLFQQFLSLHQFQGIFPASSNARGTIEMLVSPGSYSLPPIRQLRTNHPAIPLQVWCDKNGGYSQKWQIYPDARPLRYSIMTIGSFVCMKQAPEDAKNWFRFNSLECISCWITWPTIRSGSRYFLKSWLGICPVLIRAG